MMAHLTLLGYYGFGNAGDEAVLAGAIARLRAADPHAQITVISGNPDETAKIHGVHAVGRGNIARIRILLKNTDLFLLGGGGLLQDRTSRRSLWYYLAMMFWARMSGAQIACYAIGAGPLLHSSSRRLIRRMLSKCSVVSVRDAGSAQELRKCCRGKVPVTIEITADAALAMPAVTDVEKTQALTSLSGMGQGSVLRYITVAIRPCAYLQLDQSWLETLANLLRDATAAMDAAVVILPMHDGVDQPISEALAVLIGDRAFTVKTASYREAAAIIAVSEMVLTMRLHALVFAAQAGVPAIGIEYDRKVGRFAQMAGYPVVAPTAINTIDLVGLRRNFDPQAQAVLFAQLQAAESGNDALLKRLFNPAKTQIAGEDR